MISYLNIFNHHYHKILDIKKLTSIPNLLNEYLTGFRDETTKIKKFLTNIIPKQYFGPNPNIGNYYYFIRYWNTPSIKGIKRELELTKSSLQSIPTSQPDYISKIKEKLKDVLSTDIKSTHLKNINDLVPIKVGKDNLSKLLQKLKEAKAQLQKDQKWIQQQIKETLKLTNKFFEYCNGNNFKSNRKKLENLEKILDFLKKTESRIGFLQSYIPFLTSKLRGAKSKLDKPKLIRNILEKIQTIEIITTALDISKYFLQNSKLDEKINKLIMYIKSIKNTLRWIELLIQRLKYINLEILNLKSLKSNISLIRQQIQYIKYNINKINEDIVDLKVLDKKLGDVELAKGTLESIKIHFRDLNIKPIEGYIDYILNELEFLKNNLELFTRFDRMWINLKCHIESKLNLLESSVEDMECGIEGVTRNLIRCSLLSLSTHIIKYQNVGVREVDNQLITNYSLMNVVDYQVVVNRLFVCAKNIDQILQLIINIYWCKCIYEFEWSNTNIIDLHSINVQKIIQEITKENNSGVNDDLKLDKIKTLVQNDIKDNHLCLCMIIKYILYPKIIRISIGIVAVDLDTLSTISRKFHKYDWKRFSQDLSQFFIIAIELLDKLSIFILLKYKYTWVSGHPRHVKCFCMYHEDPSYYSVVSIILVISSILENIWTMDNNSITMGVNCLSKMINEFRITSSDKNSKNSNNLDVRISTISNLIMFKGVGFKNGSAAMSYSKDIRLKYNLFSFNIMSGYMGSFVSIASKLNNKHLLSSYYQIFSRLSFQLNINGNGTKLTINRSINMYLSNLYIAILKQMCSDAKPKCNDPCKCPNVKKYVLSILMSFLYNKLMSKINIINETMKIIDFVDSNRVDKIVRTIAKGINQTILNNTNLVKNSSISHGTGSNTYSYKGVKDASTSNWGYDTGYEHEIGGDNDVISSYRHPNITCITKFNNPITGGTKKLGFLSPALPTLKDTVPKSRISGFSIYVCIYEIYLLLMSTQHHNTHVNFYVSSVYYFKI